MYNFLIGLSLLILCITPNVVLSTNASPTLVLGMFVIADFNCRPLNFLVIMLERKQLKMAHSSAAKVLLWPRPQRSKLDVQL